MKTFRPNWIGVWLLAAFLLASCSAGRAGSAHATSPPDTPAATVPPPARGARTTTPAVARSALAKSPVVSVAVEQDTQFLPIVATGKPWEPVPGSAWQWQLSGLPIDQSVDADVYDIDLFDNDARVVAELHARGHRAICYLNAGAWEDWRPDAGTFPAEIKGNGLDGWPGEQWLDIRNLAVLGPLIEARIDLCKAKGFDGVEPDNIDGYAHNTGFPLSPEDQVAYNTFLANAAHARGMSIGLKNDVDQIVALEPLFDWALDEQCFQYNECDALQPFVKAGKAVFEVEYDLPPAAFCPQARAMGFSSIQKRVSLDAYRVACG